MRRINQCLNPQLAAICQQAMALEELQQKLIKFLPEKLKTTCQVSSFNKGCLTITTSDAVWATQLRYLIPELRDQLRKSGLYKLMSIKIMIGEAPPLDLDKKKKKTTGKISEQARSIILSESEQCSDEQLKEALKKLARS